MKTKILFTALISIASLAAHADCVNLSGAYNCQGQKMVITQSNIAGGVQYNVENFYGSGPNDFSTSLYIADGKPEDGQVLSKDQATATTTCDQNQMKSSVTYLYWNINPAHNSDTFVKQANGDIEFIQWRYLATMVLPQHMTTVCNKMN